MAPEQIQGGEVTERTDIYAFGVVMYEMLSGGVPFSAGTAAAILAKHLQEAPVPLRALRPEVPLQVERIVMRALEKDPQARQQDMGEVVEALRQAGAETGGQQVPVTGEVGAAPTGARRTGGLTAAAETRVRAGMPATGRFPQTVAAAPTVAAPPPPEKGRPRWKLFAVGALVVVLLASVAAVVWFTQLDFRGGSKPVATQKTAAPLPTPPAPAPGGSGSPDPTPPVVTPPPSPVPPRPPIAAPPPPPVAVTPEPRPPKGPGPGRPPGKATPGADVTAGVATGDPLQIRRLVEDRLRGGGFLKGASPDQLGVTVDVNADRVVTLTGVLRDRAQRERSVRLAREVPGVRDVKPMINVQESWKSEPD
jgi:serine/threonine-protein kinase